MQGVDPYKCLQYVNRVAADMSVDNYQYNQYNFIAALSRGCVELRCYALVNGIQVYRSWYTVGLQVATSTTHAGRLAPGAWQDTYLATYSLGNVVL